jgi:hypothetical protein
MNAPSRRRISYGKKKKSSCFMNDNQTPKDSNYQPQTEIPENTELDAV